MKALKNVGVVLLGIVAAIIGIAAYCVMTAISLMMYLVPVAIGLSIIHYVLRLF